MDSLMPSRTFVTMFRIQVSGATNPAAAGEFWPLARLFSSRLLAFPLLCLAPLSSLSIRLCPSSSSGFYCCVCHGLAHSSCIFVSMLVLLLQHRPTCSPALPTSLSCPSHTLFLPPRSLRLTHTLTLTLAVTLTLTLTSSQLSQSGFLPDH
eukprot:6178619-Pleurochrysis_carterae.AAC.2